MEKEWEKFKDILNECTNEVYGMRSVGGQRRKGDKCLSKEVCVAVAEKR